MNRTRSQLTPGFRRSQMASTKGERTRHVVTMNPSKASPGGELYVDIPKLKPDSCLVPGSLHLLFELKISNTKSHFLNNLSRLLQKQLKIRLSGETVYDNNGESLYDVYKDLYKSNSQKIRLDRIISDHGLYAPFQMYNNFRYILTLTQSSEILVAQTGQTLGEAIVQKNLSWNMKLLKTKILLTEFHRYMVLVALYLYENVTLMQTSVWDASSTLIDENINIPSKSMKAVVLLFTNTTKKDSEEFIYPNITKVKLTIEGVPNQIYSQGIPKSRFYDEAKRLLRSKDVRDEFITP